jgi:RNA polymerase sigma factor (sigma-70 family)
MVRGMIEPVEQWFAREVLAHEPSLMRYLLRVWPQRDEVTDLRQEIYVRVFDAARTKRPAAAKSFLFTAARNLMTDRLRRSRITFIGTRVDVDALELLVDEISPEQRLSGLQELACLAHAFDSLPPKCRAVMWLRKVEQLSQKDVAARLGVREKAIEKQVARGMRLLTRAVLEPSLLDPAMESFDPAEKESDRG